MKDNYQPFPLGSSFTILPPATNFQADSRRNIYMDRGAFGSGEHETTESCLEILETLNVNGTKKTLDLGSGTGILTIAALLLGAEEAWCVEIDEAAVANCRQNCQYNGIETRVTHICGTLDLVQENNFDLILANIYGDILLEVAENLVARAAKGARLLLSGILWEYNFAVRQKYERLGCEIEKNCMLTEFSTILLRKR